MIFLLDDRDASSLDSPPQIFKRLRRDRRRIFRMYAAEFRRQSAAVIRDRLEAIGRNGEWDELGPTAAKPARLVAICCNFYYAWAIHGLHAPVAAPRIVMDALRGCDVLLEPASASA